MTLSKIIYPQFQCNILGTLFRNYLVHFVKGLFENLAKMLSRNLDLMEGQG